MKLDFQFKLKVTIRFYRVQELSLAGTGTEDGSVDNCELRVVA